jgi:hypothetical protein
MNQYSRLKKKYGHLPFTSYLHDEYSENGEDGVLMEIFTRLELIKSEDPKLCVEFGAWDGKLGSNTFQFVKNHDYAAIYIESNRKKFKSLKETQKEYPSIIALNKKIKFKKNSKNSLDRILYEYGASKSFHLLSIDIDSYDLAVWESLTNFTPIIVVIEINSSIPPGILSRHTKKHRGNSFSSTVTVGTQKNYTLVCHTGNLIFVHNSKMELLNIDKKFQEHPESLFLYDSTWTYSSKVK